ncbi:MAG: porin family protein [Vicingus serpentipes]|nr:porin family protein [Vicingus serpentipes]
MKNILKVSVLALFLGVFTQNSSAQFKFSAGLDLGFVLEDGMGLAPGISLGGELPIGDNMGVSFQAGYLYTLLDEAKFGTGASGSLMPYQAGFKYYFSDNESGAYAHAQLGLTTWRQTIDLGGFGTISASTTNLSYAAGVGYLINEHLDLGFRYNIISASGGSLNYIALRAAYNF